jgi:hypothetical protein
MGLAGKNTNSMDATVDNRYVVTPIEGLEPRLRSR